MKAFTKLFFTSLISFLLSFSLSYPGQFDSESECVVLRISESDSCGESYGLDLNNSIAQKLVFSIFDPFIRVEPYASFGKNIKGEISIPLFSIPNSTSLFKRENPSLNFESQMLAKTLIGDFLVNDDTLGKLDHYSPAVASNPSGSFVITWLDMRNCNWDVYAQMYTPSGEPSGPNFKVNDDCGYAHQLSPAIAMDVSGNFVIVWADARDGCDNPDIYAQIYDNLGNPLGSNFRINDDTGEAFQYFPDIALDESGKLVFTWTDFRDGSCNPDIYAQCYSLTTGPLGSNFRVNHDTGFASQMFPSVASDGSGSFVITWTDFRDGIKNPDIYAQRYDSSANLLGSNFKVSDDVLTDYQLFPDISADNSGNFVITWTGSHGEWCDLDVYAQMYNSAGTPLGTNFKVNDDTGCAWQYLSAIAMEGSGRFVITWIDTRNSWDYLDVYAQEFSSSGSPEGGNYLVPDSQFAHFSQGFVSASANSSNIYFTWMDDRRGEVWDIYARVINWLHTDVGENQGIAQLPSSFELSQNYPNPFNPVTKIQFRVGRLEFGEPVPTSLIVYNILGQKVKTLVDEERLPGSYEVTWDGKNEKGIEVGSGIYFYQLKTKDYTKTMKMALLR
jgi:hypothetical protein